MDIHACKRYAFFITRHLRSFLDGDNPSSLSAEQLESLEIAAQCISDVFSVDPSLPEHAELFVPPSAPSSLSLADIFHAYDESLKLSSSSSSSSSPSSPDASTKDTKSKKSKKSAWKVSSEDKARAEKLKKEGNDLMAVNDHLAAIEKYTEAVSYDSSSPVYLSNRAAAYSMIGRHTEAVNDARSAIDIDPCFVKAYSRLGHALFAMGKYNEAADAYKRGTALDPTNKTMQSALSQATCRAAETSIAGNRASGSGADQMANPGADGEGDNDNSDPVAAFARASVSASAGPGGLGALFSNPRLMRMAQEMMDRNPNLAHMAQQFISKNPNLDMSSMLSNPDLMGAAQQASLSENTDANAQDASLNASPKSPQSNNSNKNSGSGKGSSGTSRRK